ncbi:MAG: T9SS type A sorting domain-containing protein [Flavobacteriales bacterium]|nr:T9SS type A sorting domain-containing protein [Flavobacteriales bacterium]
MKNIYSTLFLVISLGFNINIQSQNLDADKCGFNLLSEEQKKSIVSTTNWGYGYSDLETDLGIWEQHALVDTSFIGYSELGRKLYVLNIKDESIVEEEFRVSIHARTHPNEVQGWYATNEMINILLSETVLAQRLLSKVVFSVIPMINPDGVELHKARENANGVDIESNWGTAMPEAEVEALKSFFTEKMESDLPIDVMLNMHSAYACKRYFVYHHENGTSYSYTSDEKRFIKSIQNYFEEGIEDWDYYVSWSNGTPTRYPESWFWRKYSDEVMALTYEDMNCSSAGDYEKTAFALLSGIADYFELEMLGLDYSPAISSSLNIYPNPASQSSSIHISAHTYRDVEYRIQLISTGGRIIDIPISQTSKSGSVIEFRASNLPKGLYMVKYSSEEITMLGRLLIN